jgi:hypothetical protein
MMLSFPGYRLSVAALVAFLSVTPGVANAAGEKWVTIWGSMPQLTEPANLPPPPFVSETSSASFSGGHNS